MDIRKKFSKIYDQNIDRIYRFVFLRVNSKESAQDITSETFARAWSSFAEASTDKGRVKNWTAFLYQIARNLVTDLYRERGQFQVVSAAFVPDTRPGSDIHEMAGLGMEVDKIKEAISHLGEEQQEVVICRYLDGLSFKEIAEIVGKPEGTVRVIAHRALATLKERLGTRD